MFAVILSLGKFYLQNLEQNRRSKHSAGRIRHFERNRRSVSLYLAVFLKNEPSEICSHLSDRWPKGKLLRQISSKIALAKENERRKRKSGEEERRRREKKSNGCTLSFYIGYFGDSFWSAKKLLDLLGGNVFKNSARFICISVV